MASPRRTEPSMGDRDDLIRRLSLAEAAVARLVLHYERAVIRLGLDLDREGATLLAWVKQVVPLDYEEAAAIEEAYGDGR